MYENYKRLGLAIVKQAVKDYFDAYRQSDRERILKDLRSERLDFYSNGMSLLIADQLVKHPKEIKARLMKETEEE